MTPRRTVATFGIAAAAVGALVGGALVLQSPAKVSLSGYSHGGFSSSWGWSSTHNRGMMTTKSAPFTTLDNQADPTFNQLLGINNRGLIAGYFGSGEAGHPNQGYLLQASSRAFQAENYPGSVQTQVTGLNDRGVTVGFYSTQNTANQMNNNFGFYSWGGHFFPVNFPTFHNASPPVNQLLGVNNFGTAVGFYTNSAGNNYGYTFNVFSHRFQRVTLPKRWWRHSGGVSVTAAAINNRGDVAGFFTPNGGITIAFIRLWNGQYFKLAYPGATSTQILGINDRDQVVGAYTMGSGNSAKTFGFTWAPGVGWTSISAPMGQGGTTINGINNAGNLVGFYTDSAGRTHGLLIIVVVIGRHHRHHHRFMQVMPTPTMSPTMMATGTASPTMSPSGMASTSPAAKPAAAPTNAGKHW